MTFLETLASEGYEGVTVAGLAVVRRDGGTSVFLAQRTYDESDAPDVRETWEFVGGHLQEGEEPFAGAAREFAEEIGVELFPGEVVNGWRASDIYQGFVYEATEAPALEDLPLSSEVQAVGWFTLDEIREMGDKIRPEVRETDWSIIFEEGDDVADEETEEPEFSALDLAVEPLMIHGVLAPENTPSGDGRGFNEGALTARPLRLPFGWQEVTGSGHDGSVTVASIDRMMRKDGQVHFEGVVMDTEKADEFAGLLAFFGHYGTSIDGDRAEHDMDRSVKEKMSWFEAARISGAVACSIPAFAEAYVALGPHPDMPEDDADEEALTAAGISPGDMVGARMEFKRGPGWVKNPRATSRIHRYWTEPGQPGYRKVAWGTPGDFARAKALIGEKIAKNSPHKMRFLNQIIAQWHFDALGYWPATHAKMLRGGKGKSKTSAAWEPVMTASWDTSSLVASVSGNIADPPMEYFEEPDTTEMFTIDPPDENGLRRVYGFAGHWGVCHIGFNDKCVTVPADPTEGDYPEFHLGKTRVADGEYIRTGLITYAVGHRNGKQILAETAQAAHYDDLSNAWAAVRVGENDLGVWFSGYVLPTVSEDWLVTIQASGQVSGEWKHNALRVLLSVNVGGFSESAVEYGDEGDVVRLVASAHNSYDCPPSPAERMAAMAQVEAETRFDRLKEEFAHGVR